MVDQESKTNESVAPNDFFGWLDSISIFLIFVSIFVLVIEAKLPVHYSSYRELYIGLDAFVIAGFSLDYLVRVVKTGGGITYVFSRGGLVDFIAIVPSLFGLVFGTYFSSAWLRSFRLFRLLRVLNINSHTDHRLGIFTYVIPYLTVAVAFKCLTIVYESESWWPQIGNINTILGVTGFAVAIAMGAKLSVVSGRIYAIEDAICRVIGSIRDMENAKNVRQPLVDWAVQLEITLKSPAASKPKLARDMRLKTDALEKILDDNGVGGPVTAGFHRDVAFLLHRITASTPQAFDHFLRVMTIVYSIVLILVVPGITGLFSTVLVVLALGGTYFIVKDMDRPLDFHEKSLIDVRLDALEQFIEARV